MIYATHDGNRTIVGAADTIVEFEVFVEEQTVGERASTVEMLSDEYLSRFKLPPLIIEHDSPTLRDAYADTKGLTVVRSNNLVDRHQRMVIEREEEKEPEIEDGTTIAMLYGLDKDDPWDKRTDEENKKLYEAALKAGNLSNDDSFAAPAAAKAKVTDVRTHIGRDGTVTIDNVLAVKGLHDAPPPDRVTLLRDVTLMGKTYPAGTEVTMRADPDGSVKLIDGIYQIVPNAVEGVDYERPVVETIVDLSSITDENGMVVDHSDDYVIDPNGAIPIYHRIDLIGAKTADIADLINDLPSYHRPREMRDVPTGCWLAFVRLAVAEQVLDALKSAGFHGAIIGVNSNGERLAPDGVTVVDTEAEKIAPPRVWNDRAAEIDGMNEEERTANDKTMTGAEFIYCGKYHGAQDGCIIYVTPKSYFDEHAEMYPKPLDIAHLLPADLKEIEPGVYQTKSRDWVNLSFDLGRRGFVESMWLQLYLNNN